MCSRSCGIERLSHGVGERSRGGGQAPPALYCVCTLCWAEGNRGHVFTLAFAFQHGPSGLRWGPDTAKSFEQEMMVLCEWRSGWRKAVGWEGTKAENDQELQVEEGPTKAVSSFLASPSSGPSSVAGCAGRAHGVRCCTCLLPGPRGWGGRAGCAAPAAQEGGLRLVASRPQTPLS